jgi:hypothetical protein
MTDSEKLANYERVVQIVCDEVLLENHLQREGRWAPDEIQSARADAFKRIVWIIRPNPTSPDLKQT